MPDTPHRESDPVLAMLGVGVELWRSEPGDAFIERLRTEELPAQPFENPAAGSPDALPELVWHRIKAHQGDEFHTVTGKPFTFEVEGNGIWFFRDAHRVNRKLTRSQVEVAVSRCPLRSTTEIKDLMDYAYLFALLMDRRIRDRAW